ncbi:MAG: hypothetical protein GX638_07295, partial [Crenarchaeota archaeon]|nr:hypothetical protein [Thermoproteota archaeon]
MNAKKILSAFIISALVSTLIIINSPITVDANFIPIPAPTPAITIQSDGSINPSSSPITCEGNVYTLTENITGYNIVIAKNNVILDGANYVLNGNSSFAGIFVQVQNDVTIQNFNIHGYKYGIFFTWHYNYGSYQSSNNIISNNTLSGNTYGIYIGDFSFNNTLLANTATNNTYGIYLDATSNNVLKNNIMTFNSFNFFVSGSSSTGINDADTSNTIEGKPVIYWVNQQNKQVPSNAGYIALVNCTNILVENFTLNHNGQAMLFVGLTDSIIKNNNLAENINALWIMYSSNLTITQNIFSDNYKATFYMVSSNNTTILENTFKNGGYNGTESPQALSNGAQSAIWLRSSTNNNIHNNTFVGNGEGVSLGSSTNNHVTDNIFDQTNATAIHFYDSYENNITSNTITHGKGIAVKIWSSQNNLIKSNLIANNTIGILIDASSDNHVLENEITNSTEWGIQIKSTFDSSSCSTNNIIIHNNFINNQQGDGLDVSIPGVMVILGGFIPGLSNIWDDGFEGNYWSKYQTRYPNTSQVPGAGIWEI